MGYDNNGRLCRHSVTDVDPDTNEEYCIECGDVIENDDTEYADTY